MNKEVTDEISRISENNEICRTIEQRLTSFTGVRRAVVCRNSTIDRFVGTEHSSPERLLLLAFRVLPKRVGGPQLVRIVVGSDGPVYRINGNNHFTILTEAEQHHPVSKSLPRAMRKALVSATKKLEKISSDEQ